MTRWPDSCHGDTVPNAVIYCRISKDTEEKALGVARQEKLCRTLAEQHGLEVTEVLVDNDLSAYSRKRRPGFEQLVEMLLAGGVDAIVTYHADRLYRRASDLERLVDIVETSRTQVHTVAAGNVDLTTASGRMVARMLGAAAQHESERIGERTRSLAGGPRTATPRATSSHPTRQRRSSSWPTGSWSERRSRRSPGSSTPLACRLGRAGAGGTRQ